jgi:hypothetical protein
MKEIEAIAVVDMMCKAYMSLETRNWWNMVKTELEQKVESVRTEHLINLLKQDYHSDVDWQGVIRLVRENDNPK